MNKIDLNKNQLVEGDVKVRYWNDDKEKAEIGYLAIIDHRNESSKPFFIWGRGLTGKDQGYNYCSDTVSYKNVELIETKYRVKDFYSLVETFKNEGFLPCVNNGMPCVSKGIVCYSIEFIFEIAGDDVKSISYHGLPMSAFEEVVE